MKIVFEPPPNHAAILAAFGEDLDERWHPVYTHGENLHNPSRVHLSADLIAHEKVHSHRQLKLFGVAEWWLRYLEDTQFRYEEELLAYQVQYTSFVGRHGDRNKRNAALQRMSQLLACSLYGSLVTESQARRAILSSPRTHETTDLPAVPSPTLGE